MNNSFKNYCSKIISISVITVLIIFLTGCISFGIGGVYNQDIQENAQEIGGYLFIDSKYIETTFSYTTGLNSGTNSLGSGLTLKYPISISSLSIFPLVNYENIATVVDANKSYVNWLRIGGGLDYSFSDDFFLRGEFMYAPVKILIPDDKLFDINKAAGSSIRIGLGVRPSFFSSLFSSSKNEKQPSSGGGRTTTPAQTPQPANRDGWNIRNLDTARSVNYLSTLEKDVILELNMVRSDPRKYAQMYIDPNKSAAAREAYNELTRASSIPILQPRKGLSQAAKDHVLDTGPKGITGHTGADGSTLSQRANRYGTWGGGISENCSYGRNTGREINVQLLESSGHRKNIMNRDSRVVGVATGPHSQYRHMCVQKFAVNYTDR